jgi:hypothetical protein
MLQCSTVLHSDSAAAKSGQLNTLGAKKTWDLLEPSNACGRSTSTWLAVPPFRRQRHRRSVGSGTCTWPPAPAAGPAAQSSRGRRDGNGGAAQAGRPRETRMIECEAMGEFKQVGTGARERGRAPEPTYRCCRCAGRALLAGRARSLRLRLRLHARARRPGLRATCRL